MYRFLGIEGEYSAIKVEEDELADFISGCDESWTGFSLTMPLKERVLEVATSVDPIAERMQSANTLIRRGRNWYATSTDRTGFLSLFNSHKVATQNRVLILGAGGTARAAVAAISGRTPHISVLRRSNRGDQKLTRSVETSTLEILPWQRVDVREFDLVINTVPGEGSLDAIDEHSQSMPPLIDVLYSPWPSPLARIWSNKTIISGIELLIWQGIDQVELMTGLAFNREEAFDLLFHTLVSLI